MQLILVRHAKAFERDYAQWPDDAQRPLTREGAEEFARLAKRLGRMQGRGAGRVELMESSSFVRAWQTAQLLEEHAGWGKPVRLERLEASESSETAEGSRTQLESLIRAIVAMERLRCVAWVGHEPTLSCLASLLLGGSSEAVRVRFKKGAALALDIEVHRGVPRAELLWMVSPSWARARASQS